MSKVINAKALCMCMCMDMAMAMSMMCCAHFCSRAPGLSHSSQLSMHH